jgi:ABC-type nitrate/sulfonate/bicarbonate transport system ATPase subunit
VARNLRIVDVGLAYRPDEPVLDGVTLDVAPHELVAVVGESGCGKTSLLRIAAGLQRPTRGHVELGGEPVTRPQPSVLMVFQHYAETLLPWKTVLENVTFGLRPRAEANRHRDAARALLETMGLGGAAGRLPWELSGGMQQRVALARALVRRPAVLLLDEPFSAVDERRRGTLQELLGRIHAEHACSIVMVSHNLDDVLELASRVLVLSGRPARGREVAGAGLSRAALRQALSVEAP